MAYAELNVRTVAERSLLQIKGRYAAMAVERSEIGMKSIATKYKEICFFCGRQAECEHHLIFGTAGRELSEKDGLKVPACNDCHNMGRADRKIHGNIMAERMSKMLGQALWEREWILKDLVIDPNDGECAKELESGMAREAFRKRYGRSYL